MSRRGGGEDLGGGREGVASEGVLREIGKAVAIRVGSGTGVGGCIRRSPERHAPEGRRRRRCEAAEDEWVDVLSAIGVASIVRNQYDRVSVRTEGRQGWTEGDAFEVPGRDRADVAFPEEGFGDGHVWSGVEARDLTCVRGGGEADEVDAVAEGGKERSAECSFEDEDLAIRKCAEVRNTAALKGGQGTVEPEGIGAVGPLTGRLK